MVCIYRIAHKKTQGFYQAFAVAWLSQKDWLENSAAFLIVDSSIVFRRLELRS